MFRLGYSDNAVARMFRCAGDNLRVVNLRVAQCHRSQQHCNGEVSLVRVFIF